MAQTYDSGQFEKILDQGLALADWNGFAARARRIEARGTLRGRGIATFLEWTGGNVFEERVTASTSRRRLHRDLLGDVSAMGQGIATSYAQLAVDVFGVPIEKVRIVQGDTDRGNGFGSAGSRSLFTGGSAVRVGSERTIDQAQGSSPPRRSKRPPADIEYAAGAFNVAGTDLASTCSRSPASSPSGASIVDSTSTVSAARHGRTAATSARSRSIPQRATSASSRYASVNDIGRVVNPIDRRAASSKAARCRASARRFTKQVVYDPETGQPLTGSLMDYAAAARGAPRVDVPHGDGRIDSVQEQPAWA